jgi:hypothetical protein
VGEIIALHFSSVRVPPMKEVTCILSAIEQGDQHAANQLLPLVYDELRRMAAQKLAHEASGQTPSTVVAGARARECGSLRQPAGSEAARWENGGRVSVRGRKPATRAKVKEIVEKVFCTVQSSGDSIAA